MRTILPLISAACVLGASACAHVQSPEAEPSTVEQSAASESTTPAASDTATVQGSFASASPEAPNPEPQQMAPAQALAQNAAQPKEPSAGSDVGASAQAHGDEGAVAEDEPIARFLLARGVEDREPVDTTETFKPGERLYAFLEVANPNGGEYALNLRWTHDDGELGEPTAMTIGTSPHWRTWSWRRAPEQPGSYRCLVETEDGELVAEIPFRVDNI